MTDPPPTSSTRLGRNFLGAPVKILTFGVVAALYTFTNHDLMNESMNELVTEVFVEQPRLHRVC